MIEDTIDEVCHTYKKRFNYIAEDFFKELNLIVKVVTRGCMWWVCNLINFFGQKTEKFPLNFLG